MYTLYAKMMNAWLRSLWVWYIIYTTSTKIMASAAASMMTEACSRRPWNLTVCCTGGLGGIGGLPGAEDTLSVAECDLNYNSSSVLGVNSVSLVWDHPTLTEDSCPASLDRIFLFSHCINPTNTSLADAPMNTLLYSSDRTHLTSSTTTTQPGSSVCSYFGCYGCLGFQYYTFSEVSCTSQSSMLSSIGVHRTQLTVVPSSTSTLQTQFNDIVFPTESTVAVSSSSIWQSSVQQFNTIRTPDANPSHKSGLPIGILLPLLITSVTLFTVAVVGVWLIARHCSRSRNTQRIMMNISTKISHSALNKDSSLFTFESLHTISLHSVHTLYEEMDSTPTKIPHVDQLNDMKEESFGKGKYDTNVICDSGITCNDNNSSSTCSNHSANSADNEAASYITYGSLKNIFQDHSKSHNDSNSTT